jgi:large subunit ribosomal protein L4
MKVAVQKLEGGNAGEIELDDAIFAVSVKAGVLHRVVNWQLAKRQAGTHKTKTRAEVSGTGKKPWRQKGTGRARAGDLKRPQDRQGGIAFGPVPRSHAFDLPKKIRALGLKMALSAKAANDKLVIIDDATAKDHKTKPMAAALSKLGLDNNVLIIGGSEIDANFARATNNLPRIDVLSSDGVNVYDILRREKLVLTKEAVANIVARFSGEAAPKAEKPAKAEKKEAAPAAKKAPAKKTEAKKAPAKKVEATKAAAPKKAPAKKTTAKKESK